MAMAGIISSLARAARWRPSPATYALEQCGAIVAAAMSTREALDILNSWAPDIIVSDFLSRPLREVHSVAQIPALARLSLGVELYRRVTNLPRSVHEARVRPRLD